VRVLVTGGGGFLGSHLVARLRDQGLDPFVARRRNYDLTVAADVERLYADARPELVLHLAAVVGGIGANRANPGKFFYDNLLMGVLLMEQARQFGVGEEPPRVGLDRQVVVASPRHEGVETLLAPPRDQVGAEEASAAGDQDAHARRVPARRYEIVSLCTSLL